MAKVVRRVMKMVEYCILRVGWGWWWFSLGLVVVGRGGWLFGLRIEDLLD